ncbi:MAG: peptidylprolyl isomerase [Nanoarchaeota archaeon]
MTIKEGDRVAVNYEGRFEDGVVFDSSTHGDHSHPLVFTVGQHEVIPGFEQAVVGMNENERKEITILAKEAYGERDERLMRAVPRSEIKLPQGQEPAAGMALMTHTPDGQPIQIFIRDVTSETITLDLNHPLAGKTLLFTITVVGVNESIKKDSAHEHRH